MQHVDLIKIVIPGFVSTSHGLVSIPIPFKSKGRNPGYMCISESYHLVATVTGVVKHFFCYTLLS